MRNTTYLKAASTCQGGAPAVLDAPVESPVDYCDSELLARVQQLWDRHFPLRESASSFEEFLQVMAKLSSRLGCGPCSLTHNTLNVNVLSYIDWAVQHVLAGKEDAYMKDFTLKFRQFIEDQSTQAKKTKSELCNAYISQRVTGMSNWEAIDLKSIAHNKIILFDTKIMATCMKCQFRQEEYLTSLFNKVHEYSEKFTY